MGFLDSAKGILFGEKPKAVFESRSGLAGFQENALAQALQELSKKRQLSGGVMESLAGLEARAAGQAKTGLTGTDSGDAALTEALSGRPTNFDAAFKAGVEDPTMRTLTEQLLPTISREFAQDANFAGSDRRVAIDNAARSTGEELARQRAQMDFANTESAKQRMLAALGLLPQFAAQTGTNISTLMTPENLDLQRLQLLIGGASQSTIDNMSVGLPGTEGLVQSLFKGFGQGIGSKMAG